MKKHFLTILAVLVVLDVVAMTVWFKYKNKKDAQRAPSAALIAPSGPPPETPAPAAPSDGVSSAPMENPDGAPPEENYSSALYGPGISPGGCASLDACETYCLRPENERECLAWTQSDQTKKREAREAADPVDSMAAAMPISNAEITPGDCRGAECARYCKNKANRDECVDYCSIPKHHATCKKWGSVPRAITDALDGDLVSSEAVIDENAFSILGESR